MPRTSPEPLTRKEAPLPMQSAKKKARCWSAAEREDILAKHPELEKDNKGFIRELLRRHAVTA